MEEEASEENSQEQQSPEQQNMNAEIETYMNDILNGKATNKNQMKRRMTFGNQTLLADNNFYSGEISVAEAN